MLAREAAQELRETFKVPLWALSVAVEQFGGKTALAVRVDPLYRKPLHIPAEYAGFSVRQAVKDRFKAG